MSNIKQYKVSMWLDSGDYPVTFPCSAFSSKEAISKARKWRKTIPHLWKRKLEGITVELIV